MGTLTEYTWVFVTAIVFSFIGAFGIGANDVANAFATSVGAKSITVKQAVIIATIFEFGGAFFMGSHVAKTIRKGITDLDLFQETQQDAEILMYGMMCVTFSVAFWLLLATYWSLPVSTTHTCVGSVMGVAIAAKGWDAVNWDVVVKIVISWIASPVLSGIVAVALYMTIKYAIMLADDPAARTLFFYPLLTAFCIIIVVFYTIYKGTPQLGLKETGLGVASAVAFGCGAFMALCTYGFALPFLKEKMDSLGDTAEFASDSEDVEMTTAKDIEKEAGVQKDIAEATADPAKEIQTLKQRSSENFSLNKAVDSLVPDLEQRFQDAASDQILEMLANAEQHDEKAELAFSYLQVFSACFDAFAHGANDVANSIGPMAAVYGIWDSGVVEKEVDMPLWILGMGGVGIVAGLVLYGYNIMQAIGFELTKLSPSRGFSIELGAALVVLTGSRLEIPLSTTHCQVGATVGVGLTEGCGNVNWYLFLRVIGGWIITLVVASVLTGVIFAQGACAPKLQ